MNRPNPILPLDEHLSQAIAASSIERTANQRHDAIVIGAGAAGGMASALLAEAGMKVLCLDAGARRPFLKDPVRRATSSIVRLLSSPAARRYLPPEMIRRGEQAMRAAGRMRQPIQSASDAWRGLPEAFVDDRELPYTALDDDPAFHWLRAHMIGGRMALPGHDRQYYRLSPDDFAASDKRPHGWPLTYKKLAPWYDFVEKRIGLAGRDDANDRVPESVIRKHVPPSANETALISAITERWPAATAMLSRHAAPADLMGQAAATGYLLCRTGAIVRRIETDDRGAARGVLWHDLETGRLEKASAPVVFLCASTLESTRILMMSGDGGLGRGSGQLGRNLMDHVMQRGEGIGPALSNRDETPDQGRCIYLPQFDQRDGKDGVGGNSYNIQIRQAPGRRNQHWFTATAYTEMAPNPSNRISLDPDQTDAYGAPILRIHCRASANERSGAADSAAALRELAELSGVELDRLDETPVAPGLAAHESGTARMGDHPDQSVLDPYNQCWEAKGLYVTDAAAMPSQGRVGPALTIMALTARACAHALQQSPQETRPKARARARAQRAAQAALARAEKSGVQAKRKSPPRKRAKAKAEPGSK